MYFEVEWTTTSTPHLIGLNKAALATVLSQIVKTPFLFAISTIFSTSATAICGFDNDSKKIAFVLSSICSSKSEASSLLNTFALIPNLLIVCVNKVTAPPYNLSEI